MAAGIPTHHPATPGPGAPRSTGDAAPGAGPEHTTEILREAGLDAAAIGALYASRAIRSHE